MLRLLAPDAIAAGARAAREGHRQGQATGDQQRLPGTFIIDAQGIVRYAYYGKHAGDQPDLAELVRWWRQATQQPVATP
jgi:peroxiredoxin